MHFLHSKLLLLLLFLFDLKYANYIDSVACHSKRKIHSSNLGNIQRIVKILYRWWCPTTRQNVCFLNPDYQWKHSTLISQTSVDYRYFIRSCTLCKYLHPPMGIPLAEQLNWYDGYKDVPGTILSGSTFALKLIL